MAKSQDKQAENKLIKISKFEKWDIIEINSNIIEKVERRRENMMCHCGKQKVHMWTEKQEK